MSFVGDEVHASTLHRGGTAAAGAGKDALSRANAAGILRQLTAAHGGRSSDGAGLVADRSGPAPRSTPTPAPGRDGGARGADQAKAATSGPETTSSSREPHSGTAGWHPMPSKAPSGSRVSRDGDARGERAGGTAAGSSTERWVPNAAAGSRSNTHQAQPEHRPPAPEADTPDGPDGPSSHAADRWRAVARSDHDDDGDTGARP